MKRSKTTDDTADTATNGNGDAPKDDAPRLTIVPPAGEVPVEDAIKIALDALGPVAIDAESAPVHLRALANAYDEIERARVTYDRKKAAEKDAKAALEHATAHLLDMVREVTHPAPLPLFDIDQAEKDRAAMTGAPEL